jgi:hypothetical protein
METSGAPFVPSTSKSTEPNTWTSPPTPSPATAATSAQATAPNSGSAIVPTNGPATVPAPLPSTCEDAPTCSVCRQIPGCKFCALINSPDISPGSRGCVDEVAPCSGATTAVGDSEQCLYDLESKCENAHANNCASCAADPACQWCSFGDVSLGSCSSLLSQCKIGDPVPISQCNDVTSTTAPHHTVDEGSPGSGTSVARDDCKATELVFYLNIYVV